MTALWVQICGDLLAASRLFPGGSRDFGDQGRGSSPGLAACWDGRGDAAVAGLHVPAVWGLPVPGDLEALPPALSRRSRHVSQTQSEKLSITNRALVEHPTSTYIYTQR